MKNKKMLMVGVVVLLLLAAGGWLVLSKMGAQKQAQTQEEGKKKSKILEPKNIIAVSQRPYIKLTPVSGGHNLHISVVEVKKPATEVEYELEYQSGSLLQGFQEVLQLAKLPATTEKLFGSKSAGGAVTYHEDIKGGSFQGRFIGPENYVVKQDWRYFENGDGLTEFASKDAKFTISSDDLEDVGLLIIYNTPGYPEGLKSEPVSELYSLTSNSKLVGTAEVVIRANEEGSLQMMGYDGSAWQEIEATVEGKTVTAMEAPLLELYTVIAK